MGVSVYPKQTYLQPIAAVGIIDSHCHLDLEPLASHLSELLQEADAAGVTGFVIPGVHPDGWQRIAALSASDARIMPAFGIHPMYANLVTAKIMEHLARVAPLGVAIGEIGLDPAYTVSLDVQEAAFRRQLRLALGLDLPLLIHCRRSFQKTLTIMKEEHVDRVGGIMHAYSGSLEMAHEFIRLGFAISISGTVTWENAVRPLILARELPLEQLVLETDAPDMPPQLYRGHPNRPAFITETAVCIAAVRGIPLASLIAATSAVTRRVLRLSAD
jgi:TatD DNase family protein